LTGGGDDPWALEEVEDIPTDDLTLLKAGDAAEGAGTPLKVRAGAANGLQTDSEMLMSDDADNMTTSRMD
jgi:hypothetical protein